MKVASQYILTLILAITLVNPVCCCSWGEFFASYGEDQEDDISYSCCGGSTDVSVLDTYNGEKPVPDDCPKSCNCKIKKKFFEADYSDFTFINTFPISFSQEQPVEVTLHLEESKSYAKLVAYENPPPPDTPKRILYSIYLI